MGIFVKSKFNLAPMKVVFVVWVSLMLVFGMTLFSLGWKKQLFIQFSGYLKPRSLDSHAFHILYISGPQHFGNQGTVSWKTIFPWTGWGGVGGWSGSPVSDGERWAAAGETLLPRHCSPPAVRPRGWGPLLSIKYILVRFVFPKIQERPH